MPSGQRGCSLTGTGRRPPPLLLGESGRIKYCAVVRSGFPSVSFTRFSPWVHTAAANMRVMRKETNGNDDIILNMYEVLQQQNSTLKRLLRGSCCLKSFLKRAFDALKNLTVNLVLTAHPTQSNHWSLPQKFGRSVDLFLSVYA
ncbi:hypothetical protein F2Q68_00008875 [Brassica cretica]|uniref:Phosphoenolpyruvate carboxylase n=1 Tax=Brassica cretica TaxID=69181 RepID=A0A8S9KQZ4_BRACR|nr:hypothetical protein F2Q68_00008875 [Brassica cretica]